MTLDQLLADLSQNQIEVFLDGDRLRYRAPEGVLTVDMRVAISEHRVAIIERLRGNAPTKPPCSGKMQHLRPKELDRRAAQGRQNSDRFAAGVGTSSATGR